VLVLGPGLARGFAYVGVIRALSEAGIPIGAILGTEMGGFIGALFANTGKVNQLEWSLMKFKTELFLEQEGFLSAQDQVPSNGKAFFQQLTQIFGAKDLKDLKVPIQIAFQDNDTGQVLMVAQGNVAHAVRATMAATPLFTPSQWAVGPNSWVSVSSAGKTRPFLVQEGQAMGIGPVIAIDVLTDTEEQAAWDFVKGADLVIKPNMTGIGKLDFQKKTDAAFRGKKAVIQQISKIRHLVGLSDVDSRTSHTQKGSSL
jgi:NTE family protein